MTVQRTGFGWIETDAGRFDHDILVFPDGTVANRYDRLEGPNHRVGPEETRAVLAGTRSAVVVGTGHYGLVRIPAETRHLLAQLAVELHADRTPRAAEVYNRLPGPKCAVFHVTC